MLDRGSEFLGDFMKNLEEKDFPHIYFMREIKEKHRQLKGLIKLLDYIWRNIE